MSDLKIRNKHAILELLEDDIEFEKIMIAKDLDEDDLTKKIIKTAGTKKVSVERVDRQKMSKRRESENREVLVGYLASDKNLSFDDLLVNLQEKNQDPFFLLINRVHYENNIGVIARTAFAAGVNGLIFQGDRGKVFNEETLHYSLGTIARTPLVKMNIFEALKSLKKNNIKTFAIQMDGDSLYKENLTGPVAFILGAERKGVSDNVADRCDKKISIPMENGIDSLNVGMSAAVVLYEKVRQSK